MIFHYVSNQDITIATAGCFY